MAYPLRLLTGVEKQLERLPRPDGERAVQAMRSLRENPRPDGCVHLEDRLYRIRIGRYFVIYAVFDKEVVVLVCKVARRTEATYRNLRSLLRRVRQAMERGE